MLDSMRQNAKSLQVFFWLVIAAFVIAPAVGVFRKTNSGNAGTQNAAAVVNGKPISFTSLEQQYRNLYNFYRQIYGDNLTEDVLQNLGLERVALDQLIEQTLLVQGARQYRLQVSEAELVQSIHAIPQFQKDGRFDPETYTTLLTRSRMTLQDFEARMEEDLLAQKIELLIKEGVRVSDQEVRSEYLADNEKVQVEGVLVDVQQFVEAIAVTDEEVSAYYNEHKDAFTTPQRIKIQYLAFQPETFATDLTITAEAIQKYYATHEAEFNKGKEVKARHILVSFTPEAEAAEGTSVADAEAAALQQAKEIRQLLDEGQDFAALAEIYSDDPGSAANGGDLGFFSKGMMVPEFEAAAFALEPGAVSEPIKTQFGYHLIKVDEVREDQDPYATAKPVIEERLKTEQAKALAQKQAETVYQQVLDGKNLQQIADDGGLMAMTSQFFAQGEPIDDALGVNWQIQSAAFTLSTLQRFSEPVETTAGFYLLELLETQAPYVPELADAADDIKAAVTQQKAKDLAMAEVQKLKTALQNGTTTWADFSANEQAKTISPSPFSRRQQYISEFGSKTETIIPVAFALQEQEISDVIEFSDAYGVLRLKEKIAIDEAAFVEQKAELTKRVLSQKQNLVFTGFIEDLKQQAEIQISELLQKSGA